MSRDLVILVADKNIDYGVRGLLGRPRSLGILDIQFDTFVHPRRDPGCVREAHEFLRPFSQTYSHALVMFDRVGSGREDLSAQTISADLQSGLAVNGWGDRAAVVVLDPEIEVWVFAGTPMVEQCLGWPAGQRAMRSWLENQGLWHRNHRKPSNPKRALDEVLYKLRKPQSSALYMTLGKRVGFRQCSDPAFLKLRGILGQWFPVGAADDPQGSLRNV